MGVYDEWQSLGDVFSRLVSPRWRPDRVVGKGPGPQTMTRVRTADPLAMARLGQLLPKVLDVAESPVSLMKKYLPSVQGMLETSLPQMPDYGKILRELLNTMSAGRRGELMLQSRARTPANVMRQMASDAKYAEALGRGVTELLAQKAHDEAMRSRLLANLRTEAGNLAYNLAVKELQGKQSAAADAVSALLRTVAGLRGPSYGLISGPTMPVLKAPTLTPLRPLVQKTSPPTVVIRQPRRPAAARGASPTDLKRMETLISQAGQAGNIPGLVAMIKNMMMSPAERIGREGYYGD